MLPRLGISACLLGQPVRYDGAHKRQPWLVEDLGPHVTWIAVCPEREVGMGVPRERVDLREEAPNASLRLVGAESGVDWTERVAAWSVRRLAGLPELHGFVLKSRSPSCGLGSANVLRPDQDDVREGTGLFARALQVAWPELLLVEEAELLEPERRRWFTEQVFARAGLEVPASLLARI